MLQNDFSSCFVDIEIHEMSFRLFENSFSVDDNEIDSSIRLELIK